MNHQVGIIGFGGMAHYHYTSLKDHPQLTFKGVYDVDPQRQDLAQTLGLMAYPTTSALLEDPNISIVLVATTNEVHKQFSVMALEAGKHVICEKPVTLTTQELTEIMAVSKRTGRLFTINQNRRTNKDFLLMKERVEEGLLGDVYVIESRVEGSRGMPSGWRTLPELGGGMMYDWGVHLIDQLLLMIKEPITQVYCKMYSIDYPDVDDNFRLTLTFASGLTAHIEVSTNNYITHPRWYVLGKQGTLQIDDWNCEGKIVRAITSDRTWQDEIVYTKAGPTKTMAPRRPDTTEVIPLSEPLHLVDHLSHVYDNLIQAIGGQAPLKITAEQAYRVLCVIEAAFESHHKQVVVKQVI